jgi:hypothetical protein
MSPAITAPVSTHPFDLSDHAAWHYFDRAMVAFELEEQRGNRWLRDVREVFGEKWGVEMWSVWWWANSEEKARAKIERWRRERRARTNLLRWVARM